MSGFLRRHATTLALCALAGAGVGVLALDRGAVTTGEAEERKKNLFPAFRPDDVTDLEITVAGKTAHVRRGATTDAGQRPWEVELAGARWPAEERVVDQYLGALEMGTAERRLAEGSVDRAAFGLEPPRIAVTVSMEGLRARLAVGGAAPLPAGGVYAEVAGQGACVITRELAASLDVAPDAFRARSLVPYGAADVGALTLEGEGGARRLTRLGEGGRGSAFRFDGTTPEGTARAGAPELERVWAAIGALEADAFLDDAEADRALARRVTVTLTPRDPSRKRAVLDVGGPCPGHPDDVVAIRREPTRAAACVPAGALEGLTRPGAELVDRRVIAAPLDQVTEVKLEGHGRALELARLGPQWHLRAPRDRSIDAESGRAFLAAVLAVEADHLELRVDLARLGLDPPRATARVVSVVPGGGEDAGDLERVETVAIGDERGGLVAVQRGEDGAIARIPKDRVAPLLGDETALRDRKLFDEPMQDVRALRVEAGGKKQRLDRTETGSWRLVEPKGEGLAADVGLAEELAQALSTLSVDRWVGPDDGSYGLDRPRLTVEEEVGAAGGPKTIRVVLGAPTTSGSFARTGDDPLVFVAPRALEVAADRWLIDRHATEVDPDTIGRVTLAGEGGKRLVVERSGDALRIAGAPEGPVAAAKAAAIRDALGDLAAEAAVALGPPEKAFGLDKPQLDLVVERVAVGVSAKVPPVRLRIGAGDAWRGTSIFYARRDGVDVTYAIAQSKVRPLLDALR